MLVCFLSSGCFRNPYDDLPQPPAEVSPAEKPAARDPLATIAITFEDLDLPMEPDTLFQEWMLTQRVHDLTGRRVRVRGYMGKGLFQLKNIREFVLMRDLECCQFGPGATADHSIQVTLAAGLTTHYSEQPFVVEGTLRVAPFTGTDGKTWSVYRLDAVKIETETTP
jgi:hypothetical protein